MRFIHVLLVIIFLAFGSEVNDVSPFTHARIVNSGSEGFLEELDYIDLEVLGTGPYCVGIGFDGTYLWVTEGACLGGAAQNLIYIIDYNTHTLVGTYTQNETSGWGLRDLCCDGTYMYGSEDNIVDYYDINTYEKVGSYICDAVSPNRAQAWDGTYFYTGSFSSDIYRVTWDGVSGSTASYSLWSTAVSNGGTYGAAWVNAWHNDLWVSTAFGDYQLYQIDANGSLVALHNYNIETAGGCTPGYYNGHARWERLWVLEQGSPDALRCYETPMSLEQETWGSIKTLF